jgi:simple sugar transport system permease protein
MSTSSAQASERGGQKSIHSVIIARLGLLLTRHAPTVAVGVLLVGILVGFGVSTARFLTQDNLTNVLSQSAPSLIAAVGATLVITSGGIDLSVGSVVAVVGTMEGFAFGHGVSATPAILIGLLVGVVVGCVHGFLISYQRLPAFIVTLGSLSLLSGVAQWATKGFSLPVPQSGWTLSLGQGELWGFPIPGLIAIGAIVLGWIVLGMTAYGRHLAAIGANEEAARRAGVPTRRVTASVYVIAALSSAVAGIMIASQLSAGLANAGTGLELQTISAVVIGGTLLLGGRGSVTGTVFGVFSVALITNGLILQRLDPYYVTVAQGGILIGAIWVNTRLFARWN